MARALAAQAGNCVLVLDEIQKVSQWTEEVKRLWDEDTAAGRDVRVVILGSAPLLIARGLSESMAGRFEITRQGYWRYAEMRDALALAWSNSSFMVATQALPPWCMTKAAGLPVSATR